MRSRIARPRRYIVTAETAQHRVFVWLSYPVLPDKNSSSYRARMNGYSGCCSAGSTRLGRCARDPISRISLATLINHVRDVPFADGLTPDVPVEAALAVEAVPAIEAAAARLNALRESWLYPSNLIVEEAEIAPGVPMRRLPRNEAARQLLARRTMTALYNERPDWLVEAHRELDTAVAAAYGWPEEINDDDALRLLLALNEARAT